MQEFVVSAIGSTEPNHSGATQAIGREAEKLPESPRLNPCRSGYVDGIGIPAHPQGDGTFSLW